MSQCPQKYESESTWQRIVDGPAILPQGMDDSEMMKQSLKRHESDILRLSLTTKDSKKVVEKMSSGLHVVLNGIKWVDLVSTVRLTHGVHWPNHAKPVL